MNSLFRLITLRRMKLRPGRTALSILGIACGIALYVAISIINDATSRSFKDSMSAVSGKAALTISAGETGFDEKVADQVAAVPGVTAAAPVLESRSWIHGSSESLLVMGVDLLQEAQVRSYKTEGKAILGDSMTFISQPDSIIVTDVFAKAHHLRMNDSLDLNTANGNARFTVRGILASSGLAAAYGGALAIMDIDAARLAFGKQGRIDRIDVVLAKDANPDEMAEKIRKVVGDFYQVERPEEYSRQMDQMVSAFQFISRFFSLLALIVGVVFISNSVGMAVAERRAEIGSLRALGATRRGILSLFLVETITTGILGSLLGVVVGNAMARALVGSVTRAMTQQYQQRIDVSNLEFTSGMFFSCFLIGVAASLFGSLLPALKAMKVQPLEAMKSKGSEEFSHGTAHSRSNRRSGLAGAALLSAAMLISCTLRGPEHTVISVLGQIAAIVGAAFLGPVLLTTLIQFVQPRIQNRVSMPFRLAIDNLLRNPRRTGANVISLLVGLELVVVLSCMNTSFKETLMQFFTQILHADLIISATGGMQSHETQPLDDSLKGEVEKVPGVLGVYELQELKFNYEGHRILLKDYGEPPVPEKSGARYDIFSMLDADTEVTGPAFYHSTEPVVMVSNNFVRNFGKHTGDRIDLPTSHGKIPFRIISTVRDYANPQGVIFMSRQAYLQYFGDHLVSGFAVKLRQGYDPVTVRREIENRLGHEHKLTIMLNDEIRERVGTTIDSSFAYTNTIKLAALLVALFGLLNTLLVSVLERKRELGLARAVGMTRWDIQKMILIEAGSQGAIGALIAIGLGTGVGALWVKRTLADSLGWIVDFYVPWPALMATFGLGLLVTLVAAWYPARQASRLEIVEAIEYE